MNVSVVAYVMYVFIIRMRCRLVMYVCYVRMLFTDVTYVLM